MYFISPPFFFHLSLLFVFFFLCEGNSLKPAGVFATSQITDLREGNF